MVVSILMNWKRFEDIARKKMSHYFGVELVEKNPKGFPKKFDMVSLNDSIVGDAKFLSLVKRAKYPPAKIMEITGHVWLLEKVQATTRFLVFGNQKEVPLIWLKKFGKYNNSVDFYFINEQGKIKKLVKGQDQRETNQEVSTNKYKKLQKYLCDSKKTVDVLKYSEIEKFLEFQLPPSAYEYRAWWSNGGHTQSNSWLKAGCRVKSVVLGKSVTFIS